MGQPADGLLTSPSDTILSIILATLDESELGGAFRAELEEMLGPWLEREARGLNLPLLPVAVCEACGGDALAASPLAATWQLLRLAAKLLDDVEDGDITCQRGSTVNLATALLFIAHLALNRLEIPAERARRVGDELQRTMLRAAAGQHADLRAQTNALTRLDPEGWLTIARAKSGELFAWATWAGAYAAAAPEPTLTAYREYGTCLGVLLQVADDFNGIWHPEGVSDLAARRVSLPLCYARLVAQGAARDELESTLRMAAGGDPAAERRGQQILKNLGAQDYLIVVAQAQRQLAREALERAGCQSPGRDGLVALLEQMLALQKSDLGDQCGSE